MDSASAGNHCADGRRRPLEPVTPDESIEKKGTPQQLVDQAMGRRITTVISPLLAACLGRKNHETWRNSLGTNFLTGLETFPYWRLLPITTVHQSGPIRFLALFVSLMNSLRDQRGTCMNSCPELAIRSLLASPDYYYRYMCFQFLRPFAI